MFARASPPLSAVRVFILASPGTPSVVTVSTCNTPRTRQSTLHYHSSVIVYSQSSSTISDALPRKAPYSLTAAAQAFEKQVERRELNLLPQSYKHLRLVLMEAHRRHIAFSDEPTSPHMLRELEIALKGAIALLVTSPQQEHADLHLAIFNDIVPVFRACFQPDHPLELAAQTFHKHLNKGATNKLSHIYAHLCHLFNAAPDLREVLASKSSSWRVILWLKGLAKHPQRDLADLLPKILHDLPRIFRVQPTLLHHQLVIKGFLVRDMVDEAWNWLQQMEQNAPALAPVHRQQAPSLWSQLRHFSGLGDLMTADTMHPISNISNIWPKPHSPEYDLLLKYFAKRGDVVSARMLMAYMSAAGADSAPSQLSWHILLSAVLAAPNRNMAHVKAAVAEMARAGYSVHLKTLGGIAGRGPVKAWLESEVVDILKTAGHASRMLDKGARGQYEAGEATGSVEIARGGNRSSIQTQPIGGRDKVSPFRGALSVTLKSSAENYEVPHELHKTSDYTAPALGVASRTLAHNIESRGAPVSKIPLLAQKTQTVSVNTGPQLRQARLSNVMAGDVRPHATTSASNAAGTLTLGELPELFDLEPLLSFCGGAFGPVLSDPRPDSPQRLAVQAESISKPTRDLSIPIKDVMCGTTHSTLQLRPGSPETSTHQPSVDSQHIFTGASSNDRSLSKRLKQREPRLPSIEMSTIVPETIRPMDPPELSDMSYLEHLDGKEFGIKPSASRIPARESSVDTKALSSGPLLKWKGDSPQDTDWPNSQSGDQENLPFVLQVGDSHIGDPSVDVQDMVCNTTTSGAQQAAGENTGNATLRKFGRGIHSAIQRGDLRAASKYYAELMQIARPDIYIASALIRALCRGSLRPPPRSQIMQALSIYRDIVEAEKQDVTEAEGFVDGAAAPGQKKFDAGIYNILLQALSAPASAHVSSPDFDPVVLEYTKFAMGLLADMEARGFRPDSKTLTSVLLLRFLGAKDHQEALGNYRSLLTELENVVPRSERPSSDGLHEHQRPNIDTLPILDCTGYRAVLNAFGKLAFPNAPVPPASLWLSIADDMRKGGYSLTVHDYTVFLGAILDQKTTPLSLQRAALGIPSPEGEEDRMRTMYASVKHLHKKLSIDSDISPDAQLLNTLMNVYQHLGSFDEALRIFNSAWLSGRVDHVTPIIIFDACGHAGRQHIASTIWCMLVAKGWKFDKRTLDTWVECLCRSGNVEAACRFVCVYMGREKAGYLSKGDTRPDVQTCLILSKLSWLTGQNTEVKEKIRTHLPHVWDRLQLTTHNSL